MTVNRNVNKIHGRYFGKLHVSAAILLAASVLMAATPAFAQLDALQQLSAQNAAQTPVVAPAQQPVTEAPSASKAQPSYYARLGDEPADVAPSRQPAAVPPVRQSVSVGNMPSTVLTPSSSATLSVGGGVQKVPAGTFMTIAFNTEMDSKLSQPGDTFNALITEDFTVTGDTGLRRVILPAGTMVRGRISEVRRPGFFSHGGSIFLGFDHVVLPSGELLPLVLNLSTDNVHVNKSGAVYMDPGIGAKVEKGFEEGKKAFGEITDQGYQAGKQIAGGFGTIVTVPAAAIGGALTGTAVTTGKAAVAIIGRGDTALIKPGDTMSIDFGGSFNLPAE